MKKNGLAILVILTALILSACSGSAISPTASTTASSEALTTSYADALPVNLQLALGTLKLEENATSIDSSTASELLPLWKAVRALTESDTTSTLEMNALYSQIEQSMAAERLAAIAAMKLTTADLAQELASLAPADGTAAASASTPANSNDAAGPGGGQMPPADMAGGAPVMSGGADVLAVSPSTQATPSAARSSSSSGVPAGLLNEVIALLEGRV